MRLRRRGSATDNGRCNEPDAGIKDASWNGAGDEESNPHMRLGKDSTS
jgi:hypothetical protein